MRMSSRLDLFSVETQNRHHVYQMEELAIFQPLTDWHFPFDLLQNKTSLIGQFGRFGSEAANQPVFSKFVVVQAQLKELS